MRYRDNRTYKEKAEAFERTWQRDYDRMVEDMYDDDELYYNEDEPYDYYDE